MVLFQVFFFLLLVFQAGIAAVLHGVRPKCVFAFSLAKRTGEDKNVLNACFCAKENIAFMRIYA